MGSDEEFGPDTETIRAWLAQRATYAADARVVGSPRRSGPDATEPATEPEPEHEVAADRERAAIDERDIGRSILDAIGTTEPAHTEPARTTPTATRSAARPGTRAPADHAAGSRWQEPSDRPAVSTDVEFPVRNGARRAVSLIQLACAAATGAAGYLAAREQTPATIGVAAILGFLTLIVWAVRASITTTRLSLRRGQLHVQRGGAVEIVDIGNPHTPLAMVGEPGERRWTVLVERPGQPLLVITRAVVDPQLFTDALYRVRPELARSTTAGAVGTQ